jgi:predicted dehydrogenase
MPAWFFEDGPVGGWIGASGSHTFDQVRVWLGECESVSAAAAVSSGRSRVGEDTFVVRFRLRSGVEGVAQQTGAGGEAGGLSGVAGPEGPVGIDGQVAWIADRAGRRSLEIPADLRLPEVAEPAPAPAGAGAGPLDQLTRFEVAHYTRLCEAFLDRISGRPARSPVPAPTFADGLACMEVIDAIRASARSGGAAVAVGRGVPAPGS